jgi:tRNA threonylcarbamoyl adenosine modification protein (Sua5/YciO/YrdC/YwlC family)
VAAATETLFGLLADASDPRAIDRLIALKPRGHEKGIPLIVPSLEVWRGLVVDLPPVAERLARAFWPGPLTIALPAAPGVDPRLLVEGTVAVRLPGESAAAALALAHGGPLTATSANAPGEPPTIEADEVRRVFAPAVAKGDLHVLPGRAQGGAPSTIVTVSGEDWRVVRSGAVSLEQIQKLLAVGR